VEGVQIPVSFWIWGFEDGQPLKNLALESR
jgi:hypothetical protein